MARPAWSTDNATWIELPEAPRFGGKPKSMKRGSNDLETDSGFRFVYNLYEKRTFEYQFRIKSDTDLAIFQTMDRTVQGNTTPFYFSLAGDGSDSVYVRKEPGFDPVEIDQPNSSIGQSMYDYTLTLEEELV